MDTSHIPKTFWHSLSFCIVVGTLGIIFIAYRASSVSIEIANAKIVLSSTLSETKEIKSELEVENKRLISANRRLEEKIESLEKSGKIPKGSISIEELKTDIWKPFLGVPVPQAAMRTETVGNRLDALDAKIRSAEEAIKK